MRSKGGHLKRRMGSEDPLNLRINQSEPNIMKEKRPLFLAEILRIRATASGPPSKRALSFSRSSPSRTGYAVATCLSYGGI